MRKKKYLVGDIGVLNNKNALSILLNAEEWPVKEPNFKLLTDGLYKVYFDCISKVDKTTNSIALCDFNFIGILLNIIHYNYIKNYSIKKKINLKCTGISSDYLSPNWKKISLQYEDRKFKFNKFQRIIRRIVKAIIFNSHLNILEILPYLIKKNKYLSIGSYTNLKKNYIKKSGEFYLHYDAIDLISTKKINNHRHELIRKGFLKNYEKKIIIPILNFLQKKVDKKYIQNISIDVVVNAWLKRIDSLYRINYNLKKRPCPKKILITDCGNPLHKIIGASFITTEAKVYNFSHGNDFGLINQKWINAYLFSLCNYYVFENNIILNNFKKKQEIFKIPSFRKINFLTVNILNNIVEPTKQKSNNIKKIMLVGFPMNTKRYIGDSYCFFLYKIKLELLVLDLLNKLGFYTIYKAHPDRLNELGNTMSHYADEVITEKFEKAWELSDCIIFTYTTTSTFGYAINCKIPIILIDLFKTDYNKSLKKILNSRVSLVENVDYINYSGLSKKTLKLAIDKSANKVIPYFKKKKEGISIN